MITFKHNPDGDIYFTSDSHYFHNKPWIVEDRGFTTQEEHAQFIYDQYTSLGENDTLIHLGDVFLTCPEEEALKLLNNLKCKVVMTYGNHNAIISDLYKKSLPEGFKDKQITPLQLVDYPNITMMGDVFVLKVSKRERYWCSHYPFMVWDKMHLGELCPHLHGHCHRNLVGSQPKDMDNGKILDIGVENSMGYNNKAFFNLDEIREIMLTKLPVERDHH